MPLESIKIASWKRDDCPVLRIASPRNKLLLDLVCGLPTIFLLVFLSHGHLEMLFPKLPNTQPSACNLLLQLLPPHLLPQGSAAPKLQQLLCCSHTPQAGHCWQPHRALACSTPEPRKRSHSWGMCTLPALPSQSFSYTWVSWRRESIISIWLPELCSWGKWKADRPRH